MFFSIDANNGVAIYEQVVRQVKFAIAEEALQPGQLLPSIRALSVDLALQPQHGRCGPFSSSSPKESSKRSADVGWRFARV
ncbi:MAG: hypothetical protein R3C56_32675 [Pirellulaceae bacterium]